MIGISSLSYFVRITIFTISCNILCCLGSEKPNILIIIADDLGIGDVGCYGNNSIRTPNIDKLAEEGIKLSHHFTAEAVCTPSRAAILTARYPPRYGFYADGIGPRVLLHVGSTGHLPYSEVTLAEVFYAANYSTGLVGKWHLGAECEMFGLRCHGAMNHGFLFFYGLTTTLSMEMGRSNPFFSMKSTLANNSLYQGLVAGVSIMIITLLFCLKTKLYKTSIVLFLISVSIIFCIWFFLTHLRFHQVDWYGASEWFFQNMNEVMVRNGTPVKQTLEFDHLSNQLLNESVQYIKRESSNGNPFLLIHSFLHVHTPMFTEDKNIGRSCCGRYGDNIEEMDDGIGILIQALKGNNIQDNTIIYFLSDHGGHLEMVDPTDGQRIGGYNKRFKGGKGMGGQEGGIRVPGIIKWSKKLSANITLDHPTSAMDIMPTLLELAELPTVHELVPNENELDGRSFAEFLLDVNKTVTDNRVFLHHCSKHIHAVRYITENKVYKMHLARPNWTENSTQCGWGEVYCQCYDAIDLSDNPVLYELKSDMYEDFQISSNSNEYKNVVPFLQNYVEEWKENITYEKAIFSQWNNAAWKPWRQPFCFTNW